MSCRSEQEENTLWISLAGVWLAVAVASFLWTLLGLSSGTAASEPPAVLGLGVLFIAITFTLRLPTLSKSQPTSAEQEHLVWLLTLAATINWFGFLASHLPSLAATIPLLLLLLAGEAVWVAICKHEERLRWLGWRTTFGELEAETSKLDTGEVDSELERKLLENLGHQNVNAPNELDKRHDERPEGDYAAEQFPGEIWSTFRSGFTEEGAAFVVGENVTLLEGGQKSCSIALLFNPPFPNQPTIELEIDHEGIRAETLHITPSGARILLKRSSANEPLKVNIAWYASESVLGEEDPNSISTELP